MFGSTGVGWEGCGWGGDVKRGFFNRVACEQELKEVRVSEHSRLWRKQHKDWHSHRLLTFEECQAWQWPGVK